MALIRLAAEGLAAQLLGTCPACNASGFAIVERILGLPCMDCGTPTREPLGELLGGVRCLHRQTRDIADAGEAGPARCPCCNP